MFHYSNIVTAKKTWLNAFLEELHGFCGKGLAFKTFSILSISYHLKEGRIDAQTDEKRGL